MGWYHLLCIVVLFVGQASAYTFGGLSNCCSASVADNELFQCIQAKVSIEAHDSANILLATSYWRSASIEYLTPSYALHYAYSVNSGYEYQIAQFESFNETELFEYMLGQVKSRLGSLDYFIWVQPTVLFLDMDYPINSIISEFPDAHVIEFVPSDNSRTEFLHSNLLVLKVSTSTIEILEALLKGTSGDRESVKTLYEAAIQSVPSDRYWAAAPVGLTHAAGHKFMCLTGSVPRSFISTVIEAVYSAVCQVTSVPGARLPLQLGLSPDEVLGLYLLHLRDEMFAMFSKVHKVLQQLPEAASTRYVPYTNITYLDLVMQRYAEAVTWIEEHWSADEVAKLRSGNWTEFDDKLTIAGGYFSTLPIQYSESLNPADAAAVETEEQVSTEAVTSGRKLSRLRSHPMSSPALNQEQFRIASENIKLFEQIHGTAFLSGESDDIRRERSMLLLNYAEKASYQAAVQKRQVDAAKKKDKPKELSALLAFLDSVIDKTDSLGDSAFLSTAQVVSVHDLRYDLLTKKASLQTELKADVAAVDTQLQALAEKESAAAKAGTEIDYRHLLSTAHRLCGIKRFKESFALHDRGIALVEKQQGETPFLASCYFNSGQSRALAKVPGEAIVLLRRAVSIYEKFPVSEDSKKFLDPARKMLRNAELNYDREYRDDEAELEDEEEARRDKERLHLKRLKKQQKKSKANPTSEEL